MHFVLTICALALASGCAATHTSHRAPAAPPRPCDARLVYYTEGDLVDPDRVALLTGARRGCASTHDAGLAAADMAKKANLPHREASLLAYVRYGLRDQQTWAELGLREAQAWKKAGQTDAAVQVWSSIWDRLGQPGHPPSSPAVLARHAALIGLWGALPGSAQKTLPSREEQALHLIDLTRTRQNQQLQELINRWATVNWFDADTDQRLVQSLTGLGAPRRKRDVPTLPSAATVSQGALPLLRSLQEDRALVIAVRDPRKGLAELEHLIIEAPTHHARTRWHIEAAQLALHTKDPIRLASHALEAVSGTEGGAAMTSEALWLVALALLQQGRLDAARPFLSLSAQHGRGRASDVPMELGDTNPAARAIYWTARVDERQGHIDQARLGFERLGREDPFGLYHLLAVDAFARLGGAPEQLRLTRHLPGSSLPIPFPPVPTDAADQIIDANAAKHPVFALAASIDQARYALLNPGRHERLLDLAHRASSPADVYWLAYTLPPTGQLDVRYGQHGRRFDYPDPRDLRPQVLPLARQHGLDAEWVLALIRQESGFQTRICSNSNACGLMQLKISAADTISRATGIPFGGTVEELYKAETNLNLGIALMARLEGKFGDPVRAIAAYNAGPGAVSRWGLEPDAVPADLFLELMPDRRTRAYVIGIMVRYGFYSALFDSGRIRTLVTHPELL